MRCSNAKLLRVGGGVLYACCFSLPPRGRGTAIAVEGACATLEFVLTLFCTHSPSVALRRQLPPGGSLKLVPLGRANTVRPYYSSCGAGYHREAISSTAGGYHPSARESLADRISLRGRPSPRPGEASKKSISERGTNRSLYCSAGTRKLPFSAQKKEVRCSHFLPSDLR